MRHRRTPRHRCLLASGLTLCLTANLETPNPAVRSGIDDRRGGDSRRLTGTMVDVTTDDQHRLLGLDHVTQSVAAKTDAA